MPASSVDPGDLLDLKLMPAWVKESSTPEDYAQYQGEQISEAPRRSNRGPGRRDMPRRDRPGDRRSAPPTRARGERQGSPAPHGNRPPRGGKDFRPQRDVRPPAPEQPLDVAVQFLPRQPVLDNVVAQVQAEALAYSLFFLARSFLEKPQRYEVSLKAKPETPLFRLGDAGVVSVDRAFLEANAFRLARDQFYRVEVTQSEPLKGNFTSVARDRLSGTVLGPTNHHDYQRKLRNLYEQRFSGRMSFADYQRQIENVSDPAAVEQWKEEARSQTTFVTSNEETPTTFPNAAEAERHFRQHHLPNLIQSVEEVVVDGVASRQLGDRRLRRHIEEAWSAENRSPSHMMQELAKRFRDAALQIFRHRRGMLFVSSIRVRQSAPDGQNFSAPVKAILELVTASPRIRRKELAEKLLAESGEELETRKLSLASDLRWLISEGYVIEFNDGALDLPRVKPKKSDEKPEGTSEEIGTEAPVERAAAVESAEVSEQAVAPTEAPVKPEPAAENTPAAETDVASSESAG